MIKHAIVGKYWNHEGECGVPMQHVHYGENVVLPVPNELDDLVARSSGALRQLREKSARLEWLIEWVNENASFLNNEWAWWERLQASDNPWELEE